MKKLLFAAAAAALVAGPAAAQIPHITPFSFEGRAGVALPTGDFNDGVDPGVEFSGSITYHAIPLVGIYVGGTYAKFSVDEDDVDLSDAGLDVGARIGIPTPLIPIDPWIKAGVVVHQARVSDAGVTDHTDWGTGFEVGGGLGFGFGPVSVTPGISYVKYNSTIGEGTDAEDAHVSYLKADIGVRIRI
ncbi:MAG TPA: outer membrane beta-barrel protein [Longimicrobium sp.]|nr:outer membrane beta-barrel protein [Longimicrobium sp.]